LSFPINPGRLLIGCRNRGAGSFGTFVLVRGESGTILLTHSIALTSRIDVIAQCSRSAAGQEPTLDGLSAQVRYGPIAAIGDCHRQVRPTPERRP